MTNYSNPGLDFLRDRYGIDAAMAQALLDAALAHGGDYAELLLRAPAPPATSCSSSRP